MIESRFILAGASKKPAPPPPLPDLASWTTYNTGTTLSITAAYGNLVAYSPTLDRYVAVGASNTVLVSNNTGTSWTSYATGFAVAINHIQYVRDAFFAMRTNSYGSSAILRSTDGITWTQVLSGASLSPRMIYANGYYIAPSYLVGGRICSYSTDGITWATKTDFNVIFNVKDVFYDGSYYYFATDSSSVVRTANLALGTNTTSWTYITTPAAFVRFQKYGSNFVGITSTNAIYTSTDLSTWNSPYNSSNLTSIDFESSTGRYYASSDFSTRLLLSTDSNASTWSYATTSVPTLTSVAYNSGTWLAAGSDGIYSSANSGSTWSRIFSTVGITKIATDRINKIAGYNYRSLYVSVDGGTTFNYLGINYTVQQVAYTNGYFVFGLTSGTSYITTDGLTGNYQGAGSGNCTGAAYGNSRYVFSTSAGLYQSNSTSIYLNGSQYLLIGGTNSYSYNRVIYAGGKFVAVGNNGTISTSTTGLSNSFTTISVGAVTLYDVKYDGSKYIVVGSNNTILTSTDAVTWNTIQTAITIRSAAYANNGNNVFGVTGVGSTIAKSTNNVSTITSVSLGSSQTNFSIDIFPNAAFLVGATYISRNLPPSV